MVGLRLIIWSFFQAGIIESVGCMLAFFVVYNDFGFHPADVIWLLFQPYFPHGPSDVYDITQPYFGNSFVAQNQSPLSLYTLSSIGNRSTQSDSANILFGYSMKLLTTYDSGQDNRMGYLKINADGQIVQSVRWRPCVYNQISPVSNLPVCYSSAEIVKYAETAYYGAAVMNQVFNAIVCKTKSQSILTQPFTTTMFWTGLVVQFVVSFIICYIKPFNVAFSSRDVNLFHFGFYGSFTAIILLLYEETRKYLIRNWPKPRGSNRPNWFELRTLL